MFRLCRKIDNSEDERSHNNTKSQYVGLAIADHARERCYLTGEDLVFNDDGTCTLYLSAEDPGHPNWIQMCRLHEGLYSYRYMVTDSNPKPTIELVNL